MTEELTLKAEADAIIRYVKDNKISEIRTRLKDLRHPENAINTLGSHGQTPLWRAAKEGRLEIAELFLRVGGDPNLTDRQTRSNALHIAAESNHPQLVTLLLDHGVPLESRRVPYQETPLWLACHAGAIKSATVLVEAGADILAANSHDIDCYQAAKERTFLPVLALLRENGYTFDEPEVVEEEEVTPGIGFRVSHPVFGEGTITNTTGYDDHLKYHIEFDEEGEKLLLARFVKVIGGPTDV